MTASERARESASERERERESSSERERASERASERERERERARESESARKSDRERARERESASERTRERERERARASERKSESKTVSQRQKGEGAYERKEEVGATLVASAGNTDIVTALMPTLPIANIRTCERDTLVLLLRQVTVKIAKTEPAHALREPPILTTGDRIIIFRTRDLRWSSLESGDLRCKSGSSKGTTWSRSEGSWGWSESRIVKTAVEKTPLEATLEQILPFLRQPMYRYWEILRVGSSSICPQVESRVRFQTVAGRLISGRGTNLGPRHI